MSEREKFLICLLILTWLFLVYIVFKKQKRKIALEKQRDFWFSEIRRLDITLSGELSQNEKSLNTYETLKSIFPAYHSLRDRDEQCFRLRRLVAYDKKYSSLQQADNSIEKYEKFCDENRKCE
ncbi:hypothetical protein RyT2_23720 [Pseudolactococcus yaeyamensis]